jgi:DNA-binding beta-propeller fold protein YncE
MTPRHATALRAILSLALLLTLAATGCRKEAEVFIHEEEPLPVDPPSPEDSPIQGFYLLNEGNMGSNKATLDYYDYASGVYSRNIYGEANPGVPKELGDVGNDLRLYGSRLYAVVNCSNKVEVMDAATARRIGQVDIPNCRYIRFHEGYAYVTSYAGPVEMNPNYQQRGYVAKVDTSTLTVVGRCMVGFQPDELEIVGEKIYVANSGGYMSPNYEHTVSVIDLRAFAETHRIDVAPNLHRLRADRRGSLWVSSRGDYYSQPSRLYRIDLESDTLADSLDIAVSNFYLDGDSLYLYSAEWSYLAMESVVTYGIVDVASRSIVSRNFIADATLRIRVPYGILVHPHTKDIYLTDAGNYVSPGVLYCFDKDGRHKWNVRTGDIPAHFAFR